MGNFKGYKEDKMVKMLRITKSEKGFTLIEVLVAVAIMALIAVAFLAALGTSGKGLLLAQERTIAESIARIQMEDVKESPFATTYASSVPQEYTDKGYSASITADTVQAGLQKIIVTVFYNGEEIWTLEGYKSVR